MQNLRNILSFGVATLGTMLSIFGMCGCEKADQITTYSVPKHELIQTEKYREAAEQRIPKPKRMLGAIIPKAPNFWFLKLEGDIEVVANRLNDVRSFMKSIRFPTSETMEWSLPEGWKQLPANDIRFATLVLDGQPPLEISVTKLPSRPDAEIADQVLANLNRWRGQLSLTEIPLNELDQQTEKLVLDDTTIYLVDLMGRPRPRPAGMNQPQVTKPASRTESPSAESVPKFDKPSEWIEGPPTTFSKISLLVKDGDAKAAITVTPARGNRVDNVNRWRSQLKLDPQSEEQLAAAARKVELGSQSGDLYELTNGERTILGVIVEDKGQVWFVKLDGDSALALRERPRFEAFLKSLRLE